MQRNFNNRKSTLSNTNSAILINGLKIRTQKKENNEIRKEKKGGKVRKAI